MKRSTCYVFGAVVLALGALNARAGLIVSDSFTQTDSTNLLGTTPQVGNTWVAHSGTSAPILISGGAAQVNDATGAQDDNVPFAGGFVDSAGTVLYSSFTVTVPTPTGTLVPNYFAMFLNGTGNFTSRLWVDTPTTSGYRIALTQNNNVNPTTGSAVYTSDLTFGQSYTIVTSYDFNNKNGMLWINPTDASSPALGTTTDVGFSDAIQAYAFRQSSATGNFIASVDDLKVGTSFADVVSVPEPASVGLLIGAAGLMVRRRSRRA